MLIYMFSEIRLKEELGIDLMLEFSNWESGAKLTNYSEWFKAKVGNKKSEVLPLFREDLKRLLEVRFRGRIKPHQIEFQIKWIAITDSQFWWTDWCWMSEFTTYDLED